MRVKAAIFLDPLCEGFNAAVIKDYVVDGSNISTLTLWDGSKIRVLGKSVVIFSSLQNAVKALQHKNESRNSHLREVH